jgi:hypothetical protein
MQQPYVLLAWRFVQRFPRDSSELRRCVAQTPLWIAVASPSVFGACCTCDVGCACYWELLTWGPCARALPSTSSLPPLHRTPTFLARCIAPCSQAAALSPVSKDLRLRWVCRLQRQPDCCGEVKCVHLMARCRLRCVHYPRGARPESLPCTTRCYLSFWRCCPSGDMSAHQGMDALRCFECGSNLHFATIGSCSVLCDRPCLGSDDEGLP